MIPAVAEVAPMGGDSSISLAQFGACVRAVGQKFSDAGPDFGVRDERTFGIDIEFWFQAIPCDSNIETSDPH